MAEKKPAGNTFLENPMETPFIPNWWRVHAVFPELLNDLREAVSWENT